MEIRTAQTIVAAAGMVPVGGRLCLSFGFSGWPRSSAVCLALQSIASSVVNRTSQENGE